MFFVHNNVQTKECFLWYSDLIFYFFFHSYFKFKNMPISAGLLYLILWFYLIYQLYLQHVSNCARTRQQISILPDFLPYSFPMHWLPLWLCFSNRVKKLRETLVAMQQLDKNMSSLRSWLAHIETELSRPIVYDTCDDQEIQRKLNQQQASRTTCKKKDWLVYRPYKEYSVTKEILCSAECIRNLHHLTNMW